MILSMQGVDRKRDEYKGCGGTIHMEKTNEKYGAYIQILREELIPAMGCTEPIAVAYAAAVARQTLGELPDKVIVGASGSIIKNVKSVIVPNTDNMKGLNTAAAAGIVAGKPEKELEVIAEVTPEQTEEIKEFLKTAEITVEHVENGNTFDIVISVFKGEKSAKVRIANYHTNIVYIEKNGEVLKNIPVRGEAEDGLTDRNLLNMKDIWDFANTVDIEDVRPILEPQIRYNMAIAEEAGLDVAIPCAACYSHSKAAQIAAKEDEKKRAAIEEMLGREYKGESRALSILEVLDECLNYDELQAQIVHPLKGLKVVTYYGCLLSRPQELACDDAEDPVMMDKILTALGAEVLPWSAKTECCEPYGKRAVDWRQNDR
mgnify:CR=1 FL=1